MKKIMTVLIMLTLLTTAVTQAQKGTISTEEGIFIKNYLNITADNLLATLEKVEADEWNKRPEKGGWTIAECTEHIILAEAALWQQIQAALAQEADNTLSTKEIDGWLLAKVTDRGVKVQTPLNPKGNGKTKTEMVSEYKASRKKILGLLKDTNLPLRNHFGRSPYGAADAYQLFIIIAGHSMRHDLQINEILAAIGSES